MDTGTEEPEYVQCRRWREEVMELSRSQLAVLTGFSAGAIKDFERSDKNIDENARKRYRMACAAAEFGIEGGWLNRKLVLTRTVEVIVHRHEE